MVSFFMLFLKKQKKFLISGQMSQLLPLFLSLSLALPSLSQHPPSASTAAQEKPQPRKITQYQRDLSLSIERLSDQKFQALRAKHLEKARAAQALHESKQPVEDDLQLLLQHSSTVLTRTNSDGSTLLEIYPDHRSPAVFALSNIDWSIFIAQESFRSKDTAFTFLHLPGTARPLSDDSSGTLIKPAYSLPPIALGRAHYFQLSRDTDPRTLDFLNQIHLRYDRDKASLRQKAQERLTEISHKEQKKVAAQASPTSHKLRYRVLPNLPLSTHQKLHQINPDGARPKPSRPHQTDQDQLTRPERTK